MKCPNNFLYLFTLYSVLDRTLGPVSPVGHTTTLQGGRGRKGTECPKRKVETKEYTKRDRDFVDVSVSSILRELKRLLKH